MSESIWTIMALGMTALGLTLLYTSWRSHWRRGRRLVAVLSGWLLLVVIAMPCWVKAAGVEFGVPVSLMAPTCIVLLLLTCEWRRTGGARAGGQKTQRKDPPIQRTAARMPVGTPDSTGAVESGALLRWLGNFGRFILVVPVSALNAVLISTALSLILPFGTINNMLAVVFAVPVLWGVIAYWMLADPRGLRPVAATIAAALVSSAVLFL